MEFHVLHSSERNSDKTQTEFRQNRECKFSTPVKSTTYNFTALKCLSFPSGRSGNRKSAVVKIKESEGQTRTGLNLLSSWLPYELNHQRPKSSKSAHPPIFNRFDHAVPSTYANQNPRTPILQPLKPMTSEHPPTSVRCSLSLGERVRVRERLVMCSSLPPLTPPTPLLLCYYADGAINH